MKLIKISFTLLVMFLLSALTSTAAIKIIDADAVIEKSLQSVSITTQAKSLARLFIINQDTALTQELTNVNIATQEKSLAKFFVINEDAGSVKDLTSVNISTQDTPLAKLFIINDDTTLRKDLTVVNMPKQAIPIKKIFLANADAMLTRGLLPLDGKTIITPTPISSFTLSLDKGTNMISLPLKTQDSYTARSFARDIGSTVVIKYDSKESKFLPFVPEVSQGDGFSIEGGKGYIVNVLDSKEFIFTGTAWSNAPAKLAPQKESTHWAFVVCGTILDGDKIGQNDNLAVTVKNLRTGKLIESEAGQVENGRYSLAFVDMSKKSVINSGDSLAIYLKDNTKGVLSKPVVQKVIISDLDKSFVTVTLNTKYFIPEKNLLLQNYPNPFNPETWIPYQLKEDNNVVIRIYSSSGSLVRTMNLGYKPAGFYEGKERAVYWDGKNEVGEKVSSGIYFYTIQAGKFNATKKMIVTK
jgi:hypothetical protein